MAETKPTPSEIERARKIAVCTCGPTRTPNMLAFGRHYSNCPTELIDDIAQALATASPSLVERLRTYRLDCIASGDAAGTQLVQETIEALTATPAPEDAELVKRAGKWAMKLEANASNIRKNSPGLVNVPKKLDRQAKLLRDLADRLSPPASAWCFDMEKAPRDGTPIYGAWVADISTSRPETKVGICSWAGSWTPYDRKLFAWMLLPAPPTPPGKEGQP